MCKRGEGIGYPPYTLLRKKIEGGKKKKKKHKKKKGEERRGRANPAHAMETRTHSREWEELETSGLWHFGWENVDGISLYSRGGTRCRGLVRLDSKMKNSREVVEKRH